jgi:hypothetical protein
MLSKAETLLSLNCMYSQFIPLRVKNSVSTVKTGRLELLRKIIGANCELGVKRINKLYDEMQTFLTLQQLVRIVTTALNWSWHISFQNFARNSPNFKFFSWDAYLRLYLSLCYVFLL